MSAAEFAAWLQPLQQEPPDGALILVDETEVWVRRDTPIPAVVRRAQVWPVEPPAGDWYLLDDSRGPCCLAEVLGYDEPPEDRQVRSFTLLYTSDELTELAAQHDQAAATVEAGAR